jgi:dienelactone hydrolase
MAGRGFSSMEYFNARCSDVEPLFAFDAGNLAEARRWRIRAQAKVRDLMGEAPESVGLEAETVESVDLGTYIRERVIFDADAHSSVPAYILVPKNLDQPAPALLCLHGHGPGKDVVAGVTNADGVHTEENKRLCIQQQNCDYARQFAQRGYVTIAIDFRCFGERADKASPTLNGDPCNTQFIRGCLLGVYSLTLNLHDTIRTIDYLQTRAEVNPDLIGCMGVSLGGMMTLWATAMDKRIKAAVASGCLSGLRDAVHEQRICGSQTLPDLCRYFDLSDIASLVAPRPLLVQSGLHDETCPVDSAKTAYAKLRAAYGAWESPETVGLDVFAGGNEFHSKTAVEWMDRWLRPEE